MASAKDAGQGGHQRIGSGGRTKDNVLNTGKGYARKLNASGCATSRSKKIEVQTIEVQKVEISASCVYEIAMEGPGEPEVSLVSVASGTRQQGCRGLEDQGMSGKLIVKR